MPIDLSRGACYAKAQGSVGTPATIAQNTDLALRVVECTFTPVDALIERTDTRNARGLPAKPVQGAVRWDVVIRAEVPRLLADYTAVPGGPFFALLRACGVVDTVTYSTTDALRYRFGAHTARVPVTVEWHDLAGGNLYRAVDCVGTVTAMGETAGDRLMVEFSLAGRYVAPVATTFTEAATDYGTEAEPMRFCGATVVAGIRRADNVTEQPITGLTALEATWAGTIDTPRDATQGAFRCVGVPRVYRSGEPDILSLTVDAEADADTATGLRAWATYAAQAGGRSVTVTLNQGTGNGRVDIIVPTATYRPPTEDRGNPRLVYTLEALAYSEGAGNAGMELYFLAGS